MNVPLRDAEGNPCCPICQQPVTRPGEFDRRECYTHFIMAVIQQPGPIELEAWLDIGQQPWHTE